MALNPSVLRSALRPLYTEGSMPVSVSDAVAAWGRAYVVYARSAMAAATIPSGPFVVTAGGGPFLDALDAGLRAMWIATIWTGPGLLGSTLLVPPLQPFVLSPSAVLISSRDPEQALSLITEAVHTYTLSITVNVVPTPGTPFVVPLT